MSVDLPPQGSGGFFMSARKPIVIYDTTLRDGAQGPAVSFSAADKERIARLLDGLGFDYVEGGFPGSNPKDEELFARLGEQPLRRSRLAAFGATRRAGGRCEDDANLKALADSGAPVWTLVGKSDTWQVATVLQTTNNENLAMVEESVAYGVARGREVIFDAEHFFDGYARDAEYAIEVCLSAARAGASWVVLCDTNGGSQPDAVRDGVEAMRAALANAGSRARVGIHTHNDCELAVANSLAGVMAGADMVQGTINGYGERCGNANLVSVVANLVLKLGVDAMAGQPSQGARAPGLLVRSRRRVVRDARPPPAARLRGAVDGRRLHDAGAQERRIGARGGDGQGRGRRHAVSHGGLGQRTRQRVGRGPTQSAEPALSHARRREPARLQGAHPERGCRHGRHDTSPGRVRQGHEAMDDGRVFQQHHRGVAAGARRFAGVHRLRRSRLTKTRETARQEIPEPLRRDIRLLGGLLGKVVADYGGANLLRDVENLRGLGIRGRDDDRYEREADN